MPKFKQYPGENPVDAMKRISENIAEEGLPTSNAMERSQNYQWGGRVMPPLSPSIGGELAPQSSMIGRGIGRYNKGGKVKGYNK
jgi:hypothetical protein